MATAGEAFGVAFAADRILGGIGRLAEWGAGLLKVSQETGISVETLSDWRYAADQVGVAADSLDTGLVRLGRNIQQALTQPTGQAARAFETAGVSQQFLREHSNDLEGVLLRLASAFQAHADGAQADAVAMALFGRAGADLIPLLREGASGIEAFAAKNRELSGELSGPEAAALNRYSGQVKDLGVAWRGVGIEIANVVLPALTAAAGLLKPLNAPVVNPATGEVEAGSLGGIEDMLKKTTTQPGAPGVGPDLGRGATPGATSAGGASAKTPFGDLSQPVAELEKFRAKLDDVKLALQQQGASAQDVLLREAELWRQEASAAGLTAQEVIQARQQLDTTWSQLLKQKAAEAKAEADQETRAAKQAADEQTRDMTTNYRQQMELVKSDDDEAMAAIKAAHAADRREELLAEQTEWQRRVQIAVQGSQQQIAAERGLAAVNVQIANEQAAQWQQAERQLTESFTGPATRAFDTMISGMFNRTQSWNQTMAKAFEQMAESFIESVAKMIAQWLAFEALTAVGGGGVASALGMSGGPLAALFGAGGGAGLGALFGGGGAAGGAGAITDLAGLAMFDTGTMGVPSTQIALVHQGEIIVPPGLSDSIRSGSATLGGPGAAGGTTLAPSFNLNLAALDARSVQQLFSNPTFTRMLTNLVNRGGMLNPSLG